MTISLGMVGTTKDSTRSKGVPKFSPKLYSEMWVSIIYHIVGQAKLSDNTLEKQLCNLFSAQLPTPKVHVVKTAYSVKWSTQVKMALQPFAQEGSPVIESIEQDLNLC